MNTTRGRTTTIRNKVAHSLVSDVNVNSCLISPFLVVVKNTKAVAGVLQARLSPVLTQQLLLSGDVTLVTRGQELHHQLGVLLVRLPDGALVGLELHHVHHPVRGELRNTDDSGRWHKHT